MLSEATGQRKGELLVAQLDSPAPEILHQPQLIARKIVAVPRERAFEIPPRLLEKLGVRRRPSCQISQYVLAQCSPSSTTTIAG